MCATKRGDSPASRSSTAWRLRRSSSAAVPWGLILSFYSSRSGQVSLERSDAVERLSNSLWKCLAGSAPNELPLHTAVGVVLSASPTGFLVSPALLSPVFTPLECRLSTRDLVELLKNPLCVGQARGVILDQLENRYRQKFPSHWDFVRYAKQHLPDIDLLSPPKRPELPTARAKD